MNNFITFHISWGIYCFNGCKCNNDNFKEGYCTPVKTGDVIGVLCDLRDLERGKIFFLLNGRGFGIAYDNVTPPVSPCISMDGAKDCIKSNGRVIRCGPHKIYILLFAKRTNLFTAIYS